MVDEYPKSFIDEIFKVVDAIGLTPRKREDLASSKLNDKSQVWFDKRRDYRPLRDGLVYWEVFKKGF